jgi:hypothetical protein
MVSPQLVEPSEFGDPDYHTTRHRYASITRDEISESFVNLCQTGKK